MTLWSDRLVTELLELVPHRMVTLTVPKRIWPFFLWDRKLLGLLTRCAAEVIRLFYRHMLQEPRGTPGMVTSIQTKVALFMNTMAFGLRPHTGEGNSSNSSSVSSTPLLLAHTAAPT